MKEFIVMIRNKPVYAREQVHQKFYYQQASSFKIAVARALGRFVKEHKIRNVKDSAFAIEIRRNA